MFVTILKRRFSQVYKRKDISTRYAVYDQLIKQYTQTGNNLNTSTMKNFLLQIDPRVSRQHNYISKLSQILKQCIPHFKANSKFYTQQQLYSRIILLYQSLNIHRKQLFQLIQQAHPTFEGVQIRSLGIYYSAIIEIHHQYDSDFKIKLKDYLLKQIMNQKFEQKHPLGRGYLQFVFKTLKTILMDKDLNIKQAQQFLNYIQQSVFSNLKDISFIDRNVSNILAFNKQLLQLHNIKINNDKFAEILNSAMNYHVSQKNQSSNQFLIKQNFTVTLNSGNQIQFGGSSFQGNKRIIHHGQSSVFQTIFSRHLDQFGYDFDKNAFIGMFEYDFVIKGKKSKAYRPFQNINKKTQFKPITDKQWQTFKSMNDFNKIKTYQRWQNPMILNLNGPYHYIDSDVYGNQRVSRTDQIKYLFLQNYGYKHFNTVYYANWQQIHQKGVHIEKYIDQIISQNLLSQI